MEFLFLLAGAALGVVIGWLLKSFLTRTQSPGPSVPGIPVDQFSALQQEFARMETRFQQTLDEKNKLEGELNAEREQHDHARLRLARSEEVFKHQNEKLSEFGEMQKKLTTEFELVANRILEEKSKKFTLQNKENIEGVLNPLRDRIKDFEQKVEKAYLEESKERSALQREIKILHDLNQQVSREANNLARALKGDTKKQGNWGEIILEKVLERSGLVRDQEYKVQVSLTNEDGKRFQPDVVVYLPDEKHLVIDSKVSLVAYEAMVNAETDEEQQIFLKDHVNSIKNHIKLLSEKSYQNLQGLNTPDFVLMFVPIESSFGIAMQADQELFAMAWERRIVIVSPSTLLATLRTVSSIWKQDRQNRNAMEIAEESGKLYDKFVAFISDMEKIGKEIDSARKAYDGAMNKLKDGSGNLVRRTEKIRLLGAKNSKNIPSGLLPASDEAE